MMSTMLGMKIIMMRKWIPEEGTVPFIFTHGIEASTAARSVYAY